MLVIDTSKNSENIKKLANEFIELCSDFFKKTGVDAATAYSFANGLVSTLFAATVNELAMAKMTYCLEEFMKQHDNKEIH